MLAWCHQGTAYIRYQTFLAKAGEYPRHIHTSAEHAFGFCVSAHEDVMDYAILLSNDGSYWSSPLHASTADASFRLHEGRILTGHLTWGPTASKGTTKGRENALNIMGLYRLTWQDYYEVKTSEHVKGYRKFRYLVVKVDSKRD